LPVVAAASARLLATGVTLTAISDLRAVMLFFQRWFLPPNYAADETKSHAVVRAAPFRSIGLRSMVELFVM